ncbi:HAD hydrolase-like protein [Colwellia sp. 4_MG-2023]|uniref:HAD family hydrolase n=1 Tax=unclassified Colwellia TaxID=196834 RepID=UPI0026E24068|nr:MULTISPECIES: HAD family hydrolase [unclassified Colwellia]MDO6507743.1 HAD hydrolase-like protein [Colwellia sp. 5_MG-2023]MDO6556345.1 HAD hydrolase-like protein [Colwellia sp. 4_MG-2023]
MIEVYLFDWGDTLMVDFPGVSGKMCQWGKVEAVYGAREALETLAKTAQIYIATGAADSTELEIKFAFERVGLSQFITGYFCQENVGFLKGSPEFLSSILNKLNTPLANIAMVGDNFEKDINPAINAGIKPIWFTQKNIENSHDNVKVISKLSALYK